MAMVGRTFGVPTQLSHGCLPTKLAIYNHALYARKLREGTLKHNTSLSDFVKAVCLDIKSLWDKTDIPNYFDSDPEKAERKVSEVIKFGKLRAKVPVNRRGEDFGEDLDTLLDFSICQHASLQSCVCTAEHKVLIFTVIIQKYDIQQNKADNNQILKKKKKVYIYKI